MSKNVLVTGAGGFIGGWLVEALLYEGHRVTAVDIKHVSDWWQRHPEASNSGHFDVGTWSNVQTLLRGPAVFDEVYHLAADMGGIGYISENLFSCALNVLPTAQLLLGLIGDRWQGRFFYSSSACVYPQDRQSQMTPTPLHEDTAWPADPEPGYGLEKLYGEKLCEYARVDYAVKTRVARYHNVYGPGGSWDGGREKAPAAICRKVAHAVVHGEDTIEIWGDGYQTRSFLFIDDCVRGTLAVARGDYPRPLNVGSERMVTVNELVGIVEQIAGVSLKHRHVMSAAQGVRGRNSENSLIRNELRWEPIVPLETGLATTYRWVYDQVKKGA